MRNTFTKALIVIIAVMLLSDLALTVFSKPEQAETPTAEATPVAAEAVTPTPAQEVPAPSSPTPSALNAEEPVQKAPLIKTPPLGTKIGDFTLTWISARTAYIPEIDGYAAEYVGTTTVSGHVYMDDMQGAPCFRVSEKDKVKIPDISMSSGSPSFCFSNQDDLPQELMRSSSTEQTIFIGGYYERHVPKEATSETLLVKILKN